MSNWEYKSEMSFKASNKLINDKLFNASVHSSYYSCVQLMLHITCVHFGLDDKEIDQLHLKSASSIHQYLKKTIYESLRTHNPDYAVDFNDDIGKLNSKRNTADYKAHVVSEEEANKLRQIAYSVITELKKTFNSI